MLFPCWKQMPIQSPHLESIPFFSYSHGVKYYTSLLPVTLHSQPKKREGGGNKCGVFSPFQNKQCWQKKTLLKSSYNALLVWGRQCQSSTEITVLFDIPYRTVRARNRTEGGRKGQMNRRERQEDERGEGYLYASRSELRDAFWHVAIEPPLFLNRQCCACMSACWTVANWQLQFRAGRLSCGCQGSHAPWKTNCGCPVFQQQMKMLFLLKDSSLLCSSQ